MFRTTKNQHPGATGSLDPRTANSSSERANAFRPSSHASQRGTQCDTSGSDSSNIIEQHRLELEQANQIGAPCDRYDVILLGDLFYDTEIADVLIPWLNRLARDDGKDIYIGDPGRHGLTETRLRNMIHLARYELPPNVAWRITGFLMRAFGNLLRMRSLTGPRMS
nr:electron transfer flavoprotein beta subunit lysine methyltransferase-like [Aedes albopictus]